MDRSSGLRERKKEATRRSLHDAALRLAGERGLEAVTVEAIADGADVSRRTFSNYFSSKEEALLYGYRLRLRHLLGLIRARPAAESAVDCLAAASEEFIAEAEDRGSLWPAAFQTLWNAPAIIYQLVNTYADAERDLAAELERRLPEEPMVKLRAKVLAATYLTTLRVAVRISLRSPDHSQADILRQVLAIGRTSSS